VLVTEDSALQLGAFAAPRTEGIWDEVRADIRSSIEAEGGRVEELDGEYGPELRARVKTPDGPASVRFVGIDGPRWFVRALYQGRAAIDEAAAGPLAECLRLLVVDRGHEAMPVREALPLKLPKEVEEQARAASSGSAPEAAAPEAAEPSGSARAARRRPSSRSRRR